MERLIERCRHRHRCYLEPQRYTLAGSSTSLIDLRLFHFCLQTPVFTILFYVFVVIKQESQNRMSSERSTNCTKRGIQAIESNEKCRNAKSCKLMPCQNIFKFKCICNSLLTKILARSVPYTASLLYRIEQSG